MHGTIRINNAMVWLDRAETVDDREFANQCVQLAIANALVAIALELENASIELERANNMKKVEMETR